MTGPHVVLAEDNELVCGAYRLLFEASDFRVTTAGRVGEVIAACSPETDLLLLDLGLEDGDGFEVLDALSASSMMPRVVVALTGREGPELEARCMAAGCVAVLLKPVAARDLIARCTQWISERAER